ncbi:hypothetical protein WMY93_016200 [Mugilogobius chulae]|uniref:Rho-GAP domain-containing protein n=1 Tax=Mugilogobius chulae TaxID=88201 RepID=A0AAW0NYQ3_9GOBI
MEPTQTFQVPKMSKITDRNVIRFHLQVLYGITVKRCEKNRDYRLSFGGTRIFGVPLENLARIYIPDFGLVPEFLVKACSLLTERVATVGLFRKPGSLPRIKTLRARLNRGEDCLSTALPYDVATLVKQFCRELPEPLFPSDLHTALIKAQALSTPEDRTSALQLLSCLLPARNASTLHYLFDFLYKVSQRCDDNLMTSLNLATVFAPCLLPPPNQTEMSEDRIELRVLVLRSLIEKPRLFGVIPKTVMDSMEFLIDSPISKGLQAKRGNQKRHSFTVRRAIKTIPWIQARAKPKPDTEPTKPPSSRPCLRRSLGQEHFPNLQVFRSCLPWEEHIYNLSEEDNCTEQEKLKKDLCVLTKRIRGQNGHSSPVLTGAGKLASLRRRTSL